MYLIKCETALIFEMLVERMEISPSEDNIQGRVQSSKEGQVFQAQNLAF